MHMLVIGGLIMCDNNEWKKNINWTKLAHRMSMFLLILEPPLYIYLHYMILNSPLQYTHQKEEK